MTRINNLRDGETELDQVWGLRPTTTSMFIEDYLRSLRRVDPVLVELCRLRIAQLVESAFDQSLRYRRAVEAGLTEEKVQALADYPTSDLFSPRERAVLEFTEQWVIQSSSISDEDCTRLQEHVSVEEFIFLAKALSVMDQFARANSAFQVEPSSTVSPHLSDFIVRPHAA